jgi:hypothetical protein
VNLPRWDAASGNYQSGWINGLVAVAGVLRKSEIFVRLLD